MVLVELGEPVGAESAEGEPLAWVDPWPRLVGDSHAYGPVGQDHPAHGRAWRELFQFIKPQVRTVVLGQAASAAAVLLAAGAPGKRLALPNARVLIHQPAMEGGYA